MVQDDKNRQKVTTYEMHDKKYTVIAKCKEEAKSLEQLYDFICKYVISQIN